MKLLSAVYTVYLCMKTLLSKGLFGWMLTSSIAYLISLLIQVFGKHAKRKQLCLHILVLTWITVCLHAFCRNKTPLNMVLLLLN